MSRSVRTLLLGAALALLAPFTQAFDLDTLAAQLAKPAVVRGDFTQQKFLRALPQPLTSTGQFVLARDHGLLWRLRSPLQQDYRIDARGIARLDDGRWQPVAQQGAAAQQNRLFIAVLRGDAQALAKDFEPTLSGSADAWQLDLIPRGALLRQIFSALHIRGGTQVERIELEETQGDRSVLTLTRSVPGDTLDAREQHDFGG
jgi:hypothetical protein